MREASPSAEGTGPSRGAESLERQSLESFTGEGEGARGPAETGLRLRRYPVAGTRPVTVRLLDASGQPCGRWALADILDISLGGMCLLVGGELELLPEQKLELDVRSHPSFPWVRDTVEARWFMSSGGFTTLGIVFPSQLTSIPELQQERRGARRDPNLEAWA